MTFSSGYNIQPRPDTAWFDVGQIAQGLTGGSLFPLATVCQMLGLRRTWNAGNLKIRPIWKVVVRVSLFV